MGYIKKYSQINEELKRKLSPSKLKKQLEDEKMERLEKREAFLFTEDEIEILKQEDFEINKDENEATCIEKLATFIIKKMPSLKDEAITYHLIANDNRDGKLMYDRRIDVIKRTQHKDTLDFMIDKCSYILDNMRKQILKSIDPYGEEIWDEEDKNKMKPGEVNPEDLVGVPFRDRPIPIIPEEEDEPVDDANIWVKKIRDDYKWWEKEGNWDDQKKYHSLKKEIDKKEIDDILHFTVPTVKAKLLKDFTMDEIYELSPQELIQLKNDIYDEIYNVKGEPKKQNLFDRARTKSKAKSDAEDFLKNFLDPKKAPERARVAKKAKKPAVKKDPEIKSKEDIEDALYDDFLDQYQ